MVAPSQSPDVLPRPSRTELENLVHAATLAPSGDNTQPWRFAIDGEQGRIEFYLDDTRDPSPMNAGQRMARIAVGAAVENVLYLCRTRGWRAEMAPSNPDALAVVRVADGGEAASGSEAILAARVTNRRLYDGRPLDAALLERLRSATPPWEGIRTHWIAERGRLSAFSSLIGAADARMFGDPAMRRAFLSKVRFDRPAGECVTEGLSLASLELTFADRVALRMMPRLPDWLLRIGGIGRVFAAKARQLVNSASGLCLIVAMDAAAATDVLVGRCMQRAWLALTAEGLAAQPMMTLPVLENVLDNGSPDRIAALGRERLLQLRQELRTLTPEIGDGRPAFLLRFGFAPPPSGRTGRLPLEAVCAGRLGQADLVH